ncbi:hypothetical protein RR46_07764 [Papilio xuthus]|uniref:Cuticular protein n=1 Tax=Papilio xuthus TaxID=66420 RepID=A0A194QGC2_PAPXU|nr:hypothetical protein RR46_07764 [Papilio xuthus]
MSRIVIVMCLFVLASAMPNDGHEPGHEEGAKHQKMPDSEMPKPHDLPKVSAPPKPLDNKPQPPAAMGHNEQKN